MDVYVPPKLVLQHERENGRKDREKRRGLHLHEAFSEKAFILCYTSVN